MQNVEKFPKLCRQRKGGLEYAFITDGTRRVYLKDENGNPALYGTPQAREAYHRLLAEKAAGQAAPPKSDSITLDEVCLRFLKVKQYLSPQHYGNYRRVIDTMLAIYSGKPAVDFGVAQLKTVRQEFVNQRLCRNVCNNKTSQIRSIIKWAGSEGIIPPGIYNDLRCVKPLEKRETTAPESKPRTSIPLDDIEKTLAELSPTLAAVVRVQLANAARPSEVLNMRIENIDRTNPDLWTVIIPEHKNSWRENAADKILYLARPEQVFVEPYIGKRTEGYVFRPTDAVAEYKAAKRTKAIHKKKTPSRKARDKARAKRKPSVNECYDRNAYRRAITRACERAGVQHWYPHLVRHTGITTIGTKYGIESAQCVAGHQDLKTTQRYFHGQDTIAKSVALARNAEMEKAQATPVKPVATPSAPDNADVVQMLKQQNVMLLALLQKQGIVSLESQTDTV